MEKTVKGATKIKLAAPKSKYIEAILSATHGGDAGVAEVFRTLQLRLRDSTWTIVFKALIVVHLMIREGYGDATLKYLSESPKKLAISNFTEAQTQGANIRQYSDYLLERVIGYHSTRTDYVKVGAGKLKTLIVDKGLLRETEIVQQQISALVKCDMLSNGDPHNEITLTAFRLVTMDLLELFKVMNEGTINVLEHYFEMSKPDAERALKIYKRFGNQTHDVVQYLGLARQYELSTRLEVPKLKHAPTTLTSSLEEYLNDPDFETNRRQYLAQQEAKRTGKPFPSTKPASAPPDKEKKPSEKPASAPFRSPKGPAPDLIDFFGSIEQNQQPMAQQNLPPQQFTGPFPQAQQYQQAAFVPQQTGYNPFLQQPHPGIGQAPQQQPPQQLQLDFTGAGLGGYTPQAGQPPQTFGFQSSLSPIPQNGVANFQQQPLVQTGFQPLAQQIQPQQTPSNPFRQSMMQTGAPTSTTPATTLNRQSTNPFAKHQTPQPTFQQQSNSTFPFQNGTSSPQSPSPFTSPPPLPQTQHDELQTNSAFFTQSPPSSQQSQAPSSALQPQQTGTNPFAKVNPPPSQQAQFSPSPLVSNPTGSTNPFRQSAFVNQQTGQGWQRSTQGTFGGFDINNVGTVPVFPRPGQT